MGAVLTFNLIQNGQAAETPSQKLFVDAPNALVSTTKQITFVGPRSGEGYFSADGKKMIYQSEREAGNPFYQIFILDFETGKSTRVSTGEGMTTCGWVHPKLKKVMWSSTHLDPKFKEKVQTEMTERAQPVKKRYSWSYDDQYDIFESDLGGHKIKRLTKELGYDAEGSYSPDGQSIAFASNRSQYTKTEYSDEEKKLIERDPSYATEIYIMRADGSRVTRLTNSKGYDGGPFFSADGKKITWRRFTPDGSRAEIYTMNIDGSEQQQVTHLNAMSWAPYFHTSGQYIIFTSSILGYTNFELFIVAVDGLSKPVRVTFEEGFDGLPGFSPDGRKLSWTRRNEKGESQIYMADWNHEEALKLLGQNSRVPKISLNLSPAIEEKDARQIVSYLASDEFKGRMTGSVEEKIYTDKIAALFKTWGLEPALEKNFIHDFEFTSAVKAGEKNTLNLNGRFEKELVRGTDYQVSSFSKSGQFATAPMIFVGFGMRAPATDKLAEYDSYKDLDVKDKWVVMLAHSPSPEKPEMRQHLLVYSQLQQKVALAKNSQAAGVLLITDSGLSQLSADGTLAEGSLPVFKISTQTMTNILKKSDGPYKTYAELEAAYENMKTVTGFKLSSQYASADVELNHTKSIGRNVVGVLYPANNAGSKTKALFVGAHGDHLGDGLNTGSSLAKGTEKGQVHYGADDNASGVAGVLELAQFYSQPQVLKTLVRPIYFAVWSGEELGVLGSAYFIKDWKDQKKSEIINSIEAAFNMDMIGRLRDRLQVQGIASAKQWSGLSEEVSLVKATPLSLTNDPYLPTDSISFYLAGIPSISFTTGAHEEYHSPRDLPDTLNYLGLVRVIDVVHTFVHKLATVKGSLLNYEKVAGDSTKTMSGRSFRVYLGTIPDYSQEGIKGVRISGTAKDSPAEKAGLLTSDVIIEFDQLKIENLYDYVFALQSAKADKKMKLIVMRNDKRVELEITPVLKDK